MCVMVGIAIYPAKAALRAVFLRFSLSVPDRNNTRVNGWVRWGVAAALPAPRNR